MQLITLAAALIMGASQAPAHAPAAPVESIVQQLDRHGSIAVGWTEEGTMAIFLGGSYK